MERPAGDWITASPFFYDVADAVEGGNDALAVPFSGVSVGFGDVGAVGNGLRVSSRIITHCMRALVLAGYQSCKVVEAVLLGLVDSKL